MTPELSNLIFLEDGWHSPEEEENKTFFWTSGDAGIFLEYSFEKIELTINCSEWNVCSITISKDSGIAEEFNLVPGENTLTIDTRNTRRIKLSTPTFIPKNVIQTSDDPRSLGVRIFGLTAHFGGIPYILDIGKIQSKRYHDLKNQVSLSLALKSSKRMCSRRFGAFFDRVYCISRMEDTARRNHALKQYMDFGIDAEFIPAVDPDALINSSGKLTKQEASLCYTSKMCIQHAKINGYSSICIMEDDFRFEDGWENDFYKFQQCLPDDWDLLYLGQAEWWTGISNRKVEPVNEWVDRIFFGCGAHFIGIRDSIFDLCINLEGSLTEKLDICYWNVMRDPFFNCYAPKTSLADSISSPDKRFISKIPNFSITDYIPSRLSDV